MTQSSKTKSGPETKSSPGRILVWTEDIRTRLNDILARSIYEAIDIEMIDLGGPDSLAKFQFRRTRTGTQKLRQSLKTLGILEPITLKLFIGEDGVRTYYGVDGHTRLKILKSLLKEDPDFPIPLFRILPEDCSDADASLIAYELNRYQENFDDEDQTAAIIRIFENTSFTQSEIAKFVDKSLTRVNEVIAAFTKVPPEARKLIEARKKTVKWGEEIARLHRDEHKEAQQRIFELAVESHYSVKDIKDWIDNKFAEFEAEKKAQKVISETPPSGGVIKDDPKTLTRGQVREIHNDVVKKITRQKTTMGGEKKFIVEKGDGEYEPGIRMTERVLKDQGYSFIPGPAPKKDSTKKKERPKMPSSKELMEEGHATTLCEHCGGRTHPFVAEQQGVDVEAYRSRNHIYCQTKHMIARFQKRLEKDPITKMLENDPKLTLKKIANESHQIYKEELERRKQVWKDENLPKPAKTKKKGPKAGEPVDDKKAPTKLELFEKVRKKYPKIASPHLLDAIEKNYRGEKGYSQDDIVEKFKKEGLSGASKGTVSRGFTAVKKKMAEFVKEQ